MYEHTRNENDYYFGEIGISADNEGSIVECREREFDLSGMTGSMQRQCTGWQ